MPAIAYTAGLHELAPGCHAYLQPSGSWGLSNCGLVHDRGTALLFDTQFTLARTQTLIDTITRALPGTVIDTVVNSHPNGDHTWGNQAFPQAKLISSAATATGLCEEIGPQAMTAMRDNSDPATAAGRYMRSYFGQFDFAGITLTPATETFTGRTTVRNGGLDVDLIEVGPAHTDGDVIAVVPARKVVFAGDILFVGDHPVMWSGPIGNWITACDLILASGATTIIPGHGPVTDPRGVREFKGYLEHVAEQVSVLFGLGVPFDEAAARIPLDRYRGWGHPERLIITVGNEYRQLGRPVTGGREALISRMMLAASQATPV